MVERKKILITGISGFVGSALASHLRKAGIYEIYGINKKKELSDPRNKIFQADITDEKILDMALEIKNIDFIVHTAGLAHQFGSISKDDFWNVNVKGTENICRLGREIGVRHFILISSIAVYGVSGDSEIDETIDCRPNSSYAESKFESEKVAIEFCEKFKIRLTILRLATVVGEGDRGNTARLITAINKGRFFWIGDGKNKKSLIYKGDAARGILKILESEGRIGADIFNLTGEHISMKQIVGEIHRNLRKKERRLKIPERFARAFLSLSKKGISNQQIKKIETTVEKWLSNDLFSGAKFNEKFDFRPETSISEALARQVKFFLKQK